MVGLWAAALVSGGSGVLARLWGEEGRDEVAAEREEVEALVRAANLRVAEVAPTREERRRLAALEAQRAAVAEAGLHLRVDREAAVATLHDGPYPLRRFPLEVGIHAPMAEGSPLEPGTFRVEGVWGPHAPGDFELAPDAVEAPWPDGPPERPWDALLVGSTLWYSATPPIPALTGPALPGLVRVRELDLAAVLPSLPVGARVHVW